MTAGEAGIRAYKGLVPFEEGDSERFFGRESERKVIAANLSAFRLTLLYGTTGVGKTSVLQAGVAHDLRLRAKQSLERRSRAEFVVVVFNSWRGEPGAELTEAVLVGVEDLLERDRDELQIEHDETLATTLNRWTQQLKMKFLIILDQFEEYFLYSNRNHRTDTFFQGFTELANSPSSRVNMLVSLRDDALAGLDQFKGHVPGLFDNYLRVRHLNLAAARQAIDGPAGWYNAQVSQDKQVDIEPELIEAVLTQVRIRDDAQLGGPNGGANGSKAHVETAYLQLVMDQLWDRELSAGSHVMRAATFEREMGGAENIVHQHVAAAMAGFRPGEQEMAAKAFHQLVTPSGMKVAHSASDLADYEKLPREQLEPVLERLCWRDMRILRRVASRGDPSASPTYEIHHDVLAPAILDWGKAHSQARRTRQRQILAVVGSVLALGIIATSLFLLILANDARKDAVRQRDVAETQLQVRSIRELTGQIGNRARNALPSNWARVRSPTKRTVASVRVGNLEYIRTRGRSGSVVLIEASKRGKRSPAQSAAKGERQTRKSPGYQRVSLRPIAPGLQEWLFGVDYAGTPGRGADYFFRSGSYDFAVLGVAKNTSDRQRLESARRNALRVVEAISSPRRREERDRLRAFGALPLDWIGVRSELPGFRRLLFVSPGHARDVTGATGSRIVVDRSLTPKSGSIFADVARRSKQPNYRTLTLNRRGKGIGEWIYETRENGGPERFATYFVEVDGYWYAVQGVAERQTGGIEFESVRSIALAVAQSLARPRPKALPLGVAAPRRVDRPPKAGQETSPPPAPRAAPPPPVPPTPPPAQTTPKPPPTTTPSEPYVSPRKEKVRKVWGQSGRGQR